MPKDKFMEYCTSKSLYYCRQEEIFDIISFLKLSRGLRTKLALCVFLCRLESEDFEKLRSMECDYRGEVVECEPYDSSVGKIKAVCFQSPKGSAIIN